MKERIKASVIINKRLTHESAKSVVMHLEIEPFKQVYYEPGDSVAVYISHKTEKIRPRLYSIASSPKVHKNQVHICAKLIQYYDEKYNYLEGICTSYLATLKPNDIMDIDIKQHKKFRLPNDKNAPVIMIGPGVGFAPFRAFLFERDFEREFEDSSSRNWVFFANQYRKTTFLYEDELNKLKEKNTITTLSLAFSRDQKEKIYTQHIIEKESKNFFEWIDNGAYIYICGDKKYMAKDVEQAILQVIAKYKNINDEKAQEYLSNMKKDGRYNKSVY